MKTHRSVSLAIAVPVLLTACGGGTDDPGGPGGEPQGDEPRNQEVQAAEQVVLAVGADESTLTPYTYVTGYPGWNLLGLVYDSLAVLDEDNQPQPLLASDIQVSEDATTYTLPLREGVTWQDGEPFTGEDVAFTIQYMQDFPQSRWTPSLSDVVSVDAQETEVVITLGSPDPEFQGRLLADMPIMPQHLWEEVTDPESASMELAVGTGPYRLVEYQPDQLYRFEANADYALGAPTIQELVVPIIPEDTTAFASLQTGEVDAVAEQVPPQVAQSFASSPDIALAEGAGFASTLLQLNVERPPLDRVEVRQAIALAIEQQALVDTVLLGKGTLGSPGFMHPDSPLANTELTAEYDAEAAAALLDEIGATVGADGTRSLDGEPLRFSLIVDAASPDRIRTSELIAEMLGRIDIAVSVEPIERQTVVSQVWPEFDVANGRDFDMALWGWSAPVMLDSTSLADLVHSDPTVGTLNIGGLSVPALDEQVTAMKATVTMEERTQAAREVQTSIAEAMPFVPLYYADGSYAFRPQTYDGWVYQTGQGIVQKLSFVDLGSGGG